MALDASVFIHPTALVESTEIGARTRIWAFCHIMDGARVGSDCNVCDYVFLEPGAQVGDRVTMKQHSICGRGSRIEDGVFLGPGCILPDDRHPRSPRIAGVPEITRRYASEDGWLEETRICRGAALGTLATVLPGVTVGAYALIGSGAVVTKDVRAHQLVLGNPARPAGWVCLCGTRLKETQAGAWRCSECDRRFGADRDGAGIVALDPLP